MTLTQNDTGNQGGECVLFSHGGSYMAQEFVKGIFKISVFYYVQI